MKRVLEYIYNSICKNLILAISVFLLLVVGIFSSITITVNYKEQNSSNEIIKKILGEHSYCQLIENFTSVDMDNDHEENLKLLEKKEKLYTNEKLYFFYKELQKKYKLIETEEYVLLNLSRVSQDKEENYPGKLYAEVVYKIYKDFKLDIIYKADSDKTTLVNMTNHSYFNLSGNIKRPVTDFNLKLDCDSFLELDETSIPTGKILKVKDNKPFDFTELKSIGKDIDDNNQQIKFGKGYDHAFLLKDDKKIYVEDPKSKRNMTIQTSQDAVVIYTMNSQQKKNTYMGKLPPIRHGICFETQAPPIGKDMCFIDRSILKENEQYLQSTTYSFGLIK